MTKITETKNPQSNNLDNMSISKIIELMNMEDKEIPKIIGQNLELIEKVIKNVINSFESNGRLFYIGCGTSGRLGVLDASECPPTFKTDPSLVQGIIAGGYGALSKSIEGAEDSFDDGEEIIIVQIAGLIARRIVCEVEQGQELKQGDRIGMIRFGSRVDIYFKNKKVLAKLGQNVVAGESLLAS